MINRLSTGDEVLCFTKSGRGFGRGRHWVAGTVVEEIPDPIRPNARVRLSDGREIWIKESQEGRTWKRS